MHQRRQLISFLQFNQKRNAGLDILRACCIFLVLGTHHPVATEIQWLQVIFTFWDDIGWVGVDIFFVLSGFLVSSLIITSFQQKGRFSAVKFLTRRGFKIYPSFYFFILVTIILRYLIFDSFLPYHTLSELFFLQSYGKRLWVHTWSLAVEEHFYLSLPFILILIYSIGHRHFKYLPWLCLVIMAICLSLRCLDLPHFAYHKSFATHLRIDSLYMGVLIAYFCLYFKIHEKINSWGIFLGLSISILIFASIPHTPFHHITSWGFTLYYIAASLLLLVFLQIKHVKNWCFKVLIIIGKSSYNIYLWHILIQYYQKYYSPKVGIENDSILSFCMYFIISLFVGVVMTYIFENPILYLREMIVKRQGNLQQWLDTHRSS